MKATKKQLAQLTDGIASALEITCTHKTIGELERWYIDKGHSSERFRWDLYNVAQYKGFFNSKDLYNTGLNDTHIDTMLKIAVNTLKAR